MEKKKALLCGSVLVLFAALMAPLAAICLKMPWVFACSMWEWLNWNIYLQKQL